MRATGASRYCGLEVLARSSPTPTIRSRDDLVTRLQGALADRYAIEREVGRGGMATVYLAEDLRHHRQVALKVFKPELAAALGPERFLKEIAVTAQLHHPHILPLYDSGEAAGFLYYVMPYVDGESLRDRLRREEQLPLPAALQITREVADALSYAHSHGVIHRDIKPENILLESGHALVADFGIARAVSAAGDATLTETGIAIGTPAYMSPEQASGSRQVDGRSDLYSLGCVLYEMLSGEPPYLGRTAEAILAKKLSEPLPRISVVRETVPAGVEAALNKALARTPADRFNTATEFAGALTHPETMGATVAAPRPSSPRRRAVRLAASVAVLAVAALAATLVIRGRRPSLDPTIVVVAPFDNQIRDTSLADVAAIAADWLTQVLQGTGEIQVVPTAEVAATRWAAGGRVQDLAAGTGAGTVITGRASLQGDSIYLRADLVDGRTGALLNAVPTAVAGRREPLVAVKELARRAAGAASEILHPGVLGRVDPTRVPASYESYREYTEGERQSAAGDMERAWQHWEHAYALDSNYLMALLAAAGAHLNAGDFSPADSLFRFLQARRDRLSRIGQLILDGSVAWMAGDYQGAAAASREQARLGPPGPATANWGWFSLLANRPVETIHALEEVEDRPLARSWTGIWWYLAGAYHVLGRHQDELGVAKRGRQNFPASLSVLDVELRARAALGQEDQVDRLLDESRVMEPDPNIALDIGRGAGPWQPYEAALEFRAHGYPEAYRRAITRALDALPATGSADTTTQAVRLERAVVYYAGERWEQARAEYAQLQSADPTNVELLGGLGTSEARLGHRVAAEAVASRLGTLRRPYPHGRTEYWRARIAAVLGDRDGAVALLREALAAGFACTYHEVPHSEACHRDMDFELLRGYPPFDELLQPKGFK